ncbi:MAG: hypothetical protein ACRBG0_07205 [Lewinella sp.]|jgi:glycosyltransferase involved in cell wall biosynthesis|uniref:hypothetical protein n=1 Tax=Lewinella sp. TaxID=2004506 RepID=UPI003D6ACDC2
MTSQKRRVLFHRSWTKYNGGTSGGQLKVRDAYEHLLSSEKYAPALYYGEETVWFDNPGNFWLRYRNEGIADWRIDEKDILFFAGKDWKVLDEHTAKHPPVPIVNIAQPRHTRPEDPRYNYLQYPAIRIAKSSVGKQILEDFGVNGPVFLIPDAIDFKLLPDPNPQPEYDLLIVGLKNPPLAEQLYKRLQSRNRWRRNKWKIKVQLPPKLPTRQDFLKLVNSAKAVVFLPLDAERGAEGFYLPALEAMVMEKLVVCPYAVGNIDFCLPDKTCLQPAYEPDALFQAALTALKLNEEARQGFIQAGKEISKRHDLPQEREAILGLLDRVDEIWADDTLFSSKKQ